MSLRPCRVKPVIEFELNTIERYFDGLNENEKNVEIKAKGFLARVLQHEIDHLNGKLIIDYMPLWDRL